MAVDLASSWCATDLGMYRPCRYTYERYPLESVPSVLDALGGFRWLGDRGQRNADNVDLLTRLEMNLAAVGVALPNDFAQFYSWNGWAAELDTVSVTGCWTRLRPLPTFSPVEPGAFLVRFMSDQQDCVTWYLYLRRREPAIVVHAYGLDLDYDDDDEDFGVIYRCASSFEEFAYRFWVENRIWRHLHDPDAGPLPPRLAAYLAHYAQLPS
ncbi:hypothetical protein DKT68_19390 [Micromonospora acroterricola]|uniref:SMI1/KNR4 family protein n=1 Tax=Micromonospora acroterricola TaxID=2202421 RepID=A0A317CYI0_9ACTN|nr:hypothetical protein [Micromonospora acroterricola]PWR07244.1 hypothetical protein DKT68_19390 [Micromonospora acroterricola]